MIECKNCETARFLQIVYSKTKLTDGEPSEYIERYECTSCGRTGEAHEDEDGTRTIGTVHDTDELPKVRA